MYTWAAIFLVIALLGAFFGFSGLAGDAAGFAKIAFIVAVIFSVATFLFGRFSPTHRTT
jgi:uncharacterized membrane protein YtjA (UPF0391 family)